jgi:hypothetical protein
MVIGEDAFKGCERLTEVQFPSLLQHVESSAFSDCKGLSNVVLPEYVTYIGSQAFAGCESLRAVWLSPRLRTIGGFAFASDLEQVTMCDDLMEHVDAAGGAEKFSLFYHHPGIRNKVTELIGSEMHLRISRGFIYSEVCAEKAGKGNALKTLQEHLHIAKEECACIGDGDNDITMFENCGLRFAPQNACRDIREMADHIVSDNDHDCVWEAVRIMMEQKCI